MLGALPEVERETASPFQFYDDAPDLARLGRVNTVELAEPVTGRSQLVGVKRVQSQYGIHSPSPFLPAEPFAVWFPATASSSQKYGSTRDSG
jgi:hypothetical protein